MFYNLLFFKILFCAIVEGEKGQDLMSLAWVKN